MALRLHPSVLRLEGPTCRMGMGLELICHDEEKSTSSEKIECFWIGCGQTQAPHQDRSKHLQKN